MRPISSGGEKKMMAHVHASVFTPARILLPTDFSASSNTAMQMAADLARTYQAELYLLHVVSMFPTGVGTENFPETRYLKYGEHHAEQQLSVRVAEFASQGIKAHIRVEVGSDVVGSIMAVIERDHIDMIVLSTHGLSGWRPMVFGSIAEKVVKLVQCPLLLLHSAKEAPTLQTSSHPGGLAQTGSVKIF